MKRCLIPALVSLLVITAACSTAEQPGPATGTDHADSGSAGEGGGHHKKPSDDHKKKESSGTTRGSGRKGGSSGTDESGDAGADNGGGVESSDDGSSSAAAYPAAGTYSFAQKGYEEFCDTTGQCDKDDLPQTQDTDVSLEQQSSSAALVVSESQTSKKRLMRTWTRFQPGGALITKVYIRFEYSGFVFERTYEPKPAVEALHFPLTAGERWSGTWDAQTSGSYSVVVRDRRRLTVGDRNVTVYPIVTDTEYNGDFNGKSRVTVYVDPDTKAVVATDGVLNVTSSFGRYTTVFETKLTRGPGY